VADVTRLEPIAVAPKFVKAFAELFAPVPPLLTASGVDSCAEADFNNWSLISAIGVPVLMPVILGHTRYKLPAVILYAV
jgi:hypothetical protein